MLYFQTRAFPGHGNKIYTFDLPFGSALSASLACTTRTFQGRGYALTFVELLYGVSPHYGVSLCNVTFSWITRPERLRGRSPKGSRGADEQEEQKELRLLGVGLEVDF